MGYSYFCGPKTQFFKMTFFGVRLNKKQFLDFFTRKKVKRFLQRLNNVFCNNSNTHFRAFFMLYTNQITKIKKNIFTKHHNLHTNRKPWLNFYKIFYFRNIYDWLPRKKITKSVFYSTPKKVISKNWVFGPQKLEYPINVYFLIKNLISQIIIYKISVIDLILD